jgi:hypothetical protein
LTNRVEAARMQLLAITRDFEAMKFRLLGVQVYVPPADAELDRFRQVDATDPATLLRTAIACAILDHLEPMVRDLEAAVAAASSCGAAAESQGQGEA